MPPGKKILQAAFVGKKDAAAERLAADLRPLVEIAHWHPNPGQSWGALKKNPPPVIFVDLGEDPAERLTLTHRLVQAAPDSLVFTLAPHKSPDLILEAFRLGAADFLLWPGNQAEVLAAVRRVLEKSGPGGRQGEVFAVFSLKGGQGVSTVALNLVDHLQQLSGAKVLLFDLNLYLSELGLRLGLGMPYTPFDLQKDLKRLDQDLLFSSLCKHERGFYVLAGPDDVSDADRLRAEDVAAMLETLRGYLDYLVLDLPHDFSPLTLAALERADKILVVFQQEVAAIRLTIKTIQFFQELEYDQEKICLILNRYLRRGVLPVEDLAAVLRHPVFATLDNDYDAILDSLTKGKTLDMAATNKRINRHFQELTIKLTGLPVGAPATPWWRQLLERCRRAVNGNRPLPSP